MSREPPAQEYASTGWVNAVFFPGSVRLAWHQHSALRLLGQVGDHDLAAGGGQGGCQARRVTPGHVAAAQRLALALRDELEVHPQAWIEPDRALHADHGAATCDPMPQALLPLPGMTRAADGGTGRPGRDGAQRDDRYG